MTSNTLEIELVRQAAAGDQASLSQLLLTHFDDLHRAISKRISPDLQGLVRADDILQHTFVRAANSIDRFEYRHAGSLAAWLKTIAFNLVRDAERRRRRERRLPGQAHDNSAPDAPADGLVERLVCDGTSPSGRVERHETMRRIQIALASLSEEQRTVIQRYYLQGQSLGEIASATGRTKDAVRGVCYRARRNLRSIIGGSSLYFSG